MMWLTSCAQPGGERITALAASHGLAPAGRTTFTGIGQGRTPAQWQARLQDPTSGWLPNKIADLCQRLAELPDQHLPRADPDYQLAAYE